MNLNKYKFFGLFVLLIALPAEAQVEVNMGVLKNYRPPPMFEDTRPALAEPLSIETQPDLITIQDLPRPPKPKRKPDRPVNIAKEGLTEEDLINPSAHEVLLQIDPESAKPKPPKKRGSIETIRPTPTQASDLQKITLNFLPGIYTISKDNKSILIEDVLVKATRNPESFIEIQAFASNVDESVSGARRISLMRALEVRDFLVEYQIDPKRINIRPLGDKTSVTPTDRTDILFTR